MNMTRLWVILLISLECIDGYRGVRPKTSSAPAPRPKRQYDMGLSANSEQQTLDHGGLSNNETMMIEVSEQTVYVVMIIVIILLIFNFFTLYYIECICQKQRRRPTKIEQYQSTDMEHE